MDVDIRATQTVEQRGLSSVCVAHQCHAVDARFPPALALHAPSNLKALELVPQRRNALPDEAPVHLELAFALSKAAPDATACLFANKMAPHAPQTWKNILQLC